MPEISQNERLRADRKHYRRTVDGGNSALMVLDLANNSEKNIIRWYVQVLWIWPA
jgi:hypothetical protein